MSNDLEPGAGLALVGWGPHGVGEGWAWGWLRPGVAVQGCWGVGAWFGWDEQ